MKKIILRFCYFFIFFIFCIIFYNSKLNVGTISEEIIQDNMKKIYKPVISTFKTPYIPKLKFQLEQIHKELSLKQKSTISSSPLTDGETINVIDKNEDIEVVAICKKSNKMLIKYDNEYGFIEINKLKKLEQESKILLCEIDGNVDPYYQEVVNDELQILPRKLLELFQNSNWRMYVTDKNIATYFLHGEYGSVMGCTDWGDHTIHYENREKAVKQATLHEFGHFLDCYLNFLSSTSEYLNIYYDETNAFYQAFNVNFHYDYKEFFAEAFALYFKKPEKLQYYCPRMYNYLNNLIDSL